MSMSETVTEWRNAWAEDITVRNPETVALERPTNRASNLRSPPESPQRDLRVADDEAGPSTSGEGSRRHTEGIYERRRRPYPVAPEPLAAAVGSVSDASPQGYIAGLLFLWQTRETVSSQPAGSVRDQALEHFESQIASYLAQILDSREIRHSALLLQGDKAQAFLDAVKSVLDRGSLPTASYTTMARRLMHKLSEAHDQLPTSLFINGVYDPDEHATFAGGFGDVYRASYDGKRVALKRIRTFTADSTSPKRLKFCREALVWQALRHPSILPFLGIDRNSFPSSFCMTFEIVQGLDYLHSMNIVHGDLRGNNILISDEHHACLSDFGLATTIREDNTDTTAGPLASSSNRGGSMRWFAPELIVPEQFGCERFVRTRATDVYAFACVCIELQTGAPPFADLQEVPAMFKVLAGERPERPEEMSDGMWYLVQAAWAEDFRQRPNTSAILWLLEE
ncbi:kinase-like domain-containing protein [Mycena olivaceomarginata]|nr:kinase-like domain-containing protein [Mycena olivaceomarginata]